MTCKNCVSSAAIRQTDDETENDNILKTLASEYNRVTDVLAEKYKSSRRSLGKARYVSSFWSYAGVGTRAADDPDAPRVAMSRKALVDAVYLDKDGNVQMRKSIGYNDFLHTKLLGVLGDSFVKRSGSEYRKVYDDYKNRYQNRADWKNDKGEVSAMRCHRAAIRQAILFRSHMRRLI